MSLLGGITFDDLWCVFVCVIMFFIEIYWIVLATQNTLLPAFHHTCGTPVPSMTHCFSTFYMHYNKYDGQGFEMDLRR